MSDYLLEHCLLIDDNSVDRFVHRKLLGHHKVVRDIHEVSSGKAAMEYLHKCLRDENPRPQLILLDLMMPEMDGFEFLRHYKLWVAKVQNPPKLFMVSSTEDDRDLKRARDSEFITRLLRKPLIPDLLKEYLF